MRVSVLLVDLLIFVPGVWAFCTKFYASRPIAAQLLAFVMICMQPVHFFSQETAVISHAFMYLTSAFPLRSQAFILVDHGHFQYNCVALALVVWAVAFALHDKHIPCGICFAMALCFKQTLLYYAPAFFFYLLGQCLFQRKNPLLSLVQLGLAVIAVFALSFGYVAAAVLLASWLLLVGLSTPLC